MLWSSEVLEMSIVGTGWKTSTLLVVSASESCPDPFRMKETKGPPNLGAEKHSFPVPSATEPWPSSGRCNYRHRVRTRKPSHFGKYGTQRNSQNEWMDGVNDPRNRLWRKLVTTKSHWLYAFIGVWNVQKRHFRDRKQTVRPGTGELWIAANGNCSFVGWW